MNQYGNNGFDDRDHYLGTMAEQYDVSIDLVYALADVLGEDEDFDGLIAAIEDFR